MSLARLGEQRTEIAVTSSADVVVAWKAVYDSDERTVDRADSKVYRRNKGEAILLICPPGP